jgi:hypothetical protein
VDALEQLIRDSGLSLYALEQRTGVRKQKLSAWLNGVNFPQWAGANRVLTVLLAHCDYSRNRQLSAAWKTAWQAAAAKRSKGNTASAAGTPTMPGSWRANSGYVQGEVRRIAPVELLDREAELNDLARFCGGEQRSTWWSGDLWSGKSALLATFALSPPAGVEVVSFFVNSRLQKHGDAAAFARWIREQLWWLSGRPFITVQHRVQSAHNLRPDLRRTGTGPVTRSAVD